MTAPEVWMPVVGFEDLYSVSNRGNVTSKPRPRTKGGLFSTRGRDSKGYVVVCLCRDGKETYRRVHTLMLESFVGPRPIGYEALHGNGIPSDNRLGNLRWGTRSENQKDSVRHGTNAIVRCNERRRAC